MDINVSATSAYPSSNAISSNRVKDPTDRTDNSDSELSAEQRQEIKALKARDQEVRAHEAAHIAAGGGLVRGGASFSFQRGPDGVQYAVGGEVNIDTSEVAGNPQATLQKANQIQAAALAPAQPSSQDRSVAARAAKMAIEARAEITQQRKDESEQQTNNATSFLAKASQTAFAIDLTA